MTCDGITGGVGASQGVGQTSGIKNDEEEQKKKIISTDQALANNSAFVAWSHASQSVDGSNSTQGYLS